MTPTHLYWQGRAACGATGDVRLVDATRPTCPTCRRIREQHQAQQVAQTEQATWGLR